MSKGHEHLNADDVRQIQSLLFAFGIAVETGELTQQAMIDTTIAIGDLIRLRAQENAAPEGAE